MMIIAKYIKEKPFLVSLRCKYQKFTSLSHVKCVPVTPVGHAPKVSSKPFIKT